jgi:hypothetical protein
MHRLVALLFCTACAARADPTPAPTDTVAPWTAASPSTAASPEGAPDALRRVAADHGLAMAGDWSWTETDREQTRFDWTGVPPGGAHEVRWSFWVEGDDMEQMRPFLPQIVLSAAMNLTREPACEPFEQPPEVARIVGADRVITVCFTPAPYMSDTYRFGVLHGLVRGEVLVIVVVLANDRTGTMPLPDAIGGRFAAP